MVVNITTLPNASGLVCKSTGGPATTVIWKINNHELIVAGIAYQQSQRIASTENATFENILHIPSDSIANYDATYKCIVINSVGNDSMRFRPKGKWIAVDE